MARPTRPRRYTPRPSAAAAELILRAARRVTADAGGRHWTAGYAFRAADLADDLSHSLTPGTLRHYLAALARSGHLRRIAQGVYEPTRPDAHSR